MPGPPPNRDSDLSRPRDRRGEAGGNAGIPATKGELKPVNRPAPDPDWAPVAKMAYDSLITSGMADFYQDSDWAYAWIVLSELDVYRRRGTDKDGNPYATHKPSGQMFQAIMSAMVSLGMTEGDRRRMRIELEDPKPEEEPATVLAIADYRKDLGLDD